VLVIEVFSHYGIGELISEGTRSMKRKASISHDDAIVRELWEHPEFAEE
jgi:hypothetical protein